MPRGQECPPAMPESLKRGVRLRGIVCRLQPCATRSVGGHAPRSERPPAMPESLKSGVRFRGIVCRLPPCATLPCEKRLPLTAPPHNPHYDRLCVTFRGRLGRLYGLGVVLRLPPPQRYAK